MKDRKRQRENRRLKNKEKLLDRRSSCGVKDLTAYNAVAAMKLPAHHKRLKLCKSGRAKRR